MKAYEKLLLENKAWAAEKLELNADYFASLAIEQHPKFLWIGCSDSRVPANEITNTEPGEIFVHRNIANMVVHTDVNMLSVLQYAVQVLKVEHILVVGHYGCGGVKAAMGHNDLGLINKWLLNIKEVYKTHFDEIQSIQDETDRTNRLVELNIMAQVDNLMKTSIVQGAWKDRNAPTVHGWVYGLADGQIRELVKVSPGDPIDPMFKIEF